MSVVANFLNDGVNSPILVGFSYVYSFPNEVVSCRIFFHF